MTENELIESTRTGKWVPPFEKYTIEEMKSGQCTTKYPKQDEGCPAWRQWLSQYADYENILTSYMKNNNISGEVVNAYVGYFKISDSGVKFPNNSSGVIFPKGL